MSTFIITISAADRLKNKKQLLTNDFGGIYFINSTEDGWVEIPRVV